jgi:hypothetical protein
LSRARLFLATLPLRRSEFKDEVVTVLTEINGYLINFFAASLWWP